MKKILITGANSYLAKNFIDICKDNFYIIATSTSKNLRNDSINELIYVKENYEELNNKVKECDFIIHFAWSRESSDNIENLNYINFLLDKKKPTTIFYFVSSVAASPNAISTYGKQKYMGNKITTKKGGSNIILGSVIASGSSQLETILRVIRLLPFSIRFSYNFLKTYNIELNSFNEKLLNVLINSRVEENIIMFDQILEINDFIKFIENKYSIKRKYRIIIPVFFIKMFIFFTKNLPFKISFVDKILTFFYKDDEWIKKL